MHQLRIEKINGFLIECCRFLKLTEGGFDLCKLTKINGQVKFIPGSPDGVESLLCCLVGGVEVSCFEINLHKFRAVARYLCMSIRSLRQIDRIFETRDGESRIASPVGHRAHFCEQLRLISEASSLSGLCKRMFE